MTNIYFDDFTKIINNKLKEAENKVIIAVAWINFDIYYCCFLELLNKGIKLEVIINSDVNNRIYSNSVVRLQEAGMKLKCLKMPRGRQYMHHKFCVIDNRIALTGSYNWTKNATNKNFENLLITQNKTVIRKLSVEFNKMKEIKTDQIRKLQNLIKCPVCKTEMISICILNQEGENHTEINVFSICECGNNKIFEDYADISLLNNLQDIGNRFSEYFEDNISVDDQSLLEAEYDFEIDNYLLMVLSYIRKNNPKKREALPIINAIGIKTFSKQEPFAGDPIINIIWKSRFSASIIEAEYDLSEFE